ncbi:MAG: ATP-dependent protease [Actinomycetota bacterium]|nr:MAG: ATP-dependent protease [Actinomycetota bacterium]
MPLPMFPLSSVVFPVTGVPLHVFEPRYKRLISDLSRTPPYFGVVLITRGSEVGGGDVRSDVGTMVRISEKAQLGEGRWLVLAVGEKRIRIRTWLPDDPYPLALVEEIAERAWGPESDEWLRSLEKKLRYCLLLYGEISLSNSVSQNIVLSSVPEEALWQMCALAPISMLDQQRLLVAPDPPARADLLDKLLSEAISFFEAQLSL